MEKHPIEEFRYSEKILIIVFFVFAFFIFDNLKLMIYGSFSLVDALTIKMLLTLSCLLIVSLAFVFTLKDRIYALASVLGLLYGLAGFVISYFVGVSIIFVVWHGIMAAFLGATLLVYDRLKKYKGLVNKMTNKQNLLSIKGDVFEFFKIIIQCLIAVTATIGVCMSILFKNDINNKELKINAIWIVVGFGFCTAALVFWIVIPMFQIINDTNQKVSKEYPVAKISTNMHSLIRYKERK